MSSSEFWIWCESRLGLIVGCQKIISMMKVGDKWRAYIDSSMAYGDEGRPGIPPNSILIFDIELLDIE